MTSNSYATRHLKIHTIVAKKKLLNKTETAVQSQDDEKN